MAVPLDLISNFIGQKNFIRLLLSFLFGRIARKEAVLHGLQAIPEMFGGICNCLERCRAHWKRLKRRWQQ